MQSTREPWVRCLFSNLRDTLFCLRPKSIMDTLCRYATMWEALGRLQPLDFVGREPDSQKKPPLSKPASGFSRGVQMAGKQGVGISVARAPQGLRGSARSPQSAAAKHGAQSRPAWAVFAAIVLLAVAALVATQA